MVVEPMQIGLVFWAAKDARAALEDLLSFGLQAGQLGVPPTMDCGTPPSPRGKKPCTSIPSISPRAVCAYAGEDYASLEHVHQTVGFTAPATPKTHRPHQRRIHLRSQAGIKAVSCHIGFIPSNATSPMYNVLIDIAREVCDFCAHHDQNFVLKSGQESAETLHTFLRDTGRPNLGVNFDPANMILYGSGDPIRGARPPSKRRPLRPLQGRPLPQRPRSAGPRMRPRRW